MVLTRGMRQKLLEANPQPPPPPPQPSTSSRVKKVDKGEDQHYVLHELTFTTIPRRRGGNRKRKVLEEDATVKVSNMKTTNKKGKKGKGQGSRKPVELSAPVVEDKTQYSAGEKKGKRRVPLQQIDPLGGGALSKPDVAEEPTLPCTSRDATRYAAATASGFSDLLTETTTPRMPKKGVNKNKDVNPVPPLMKPRLLFGAEEENDSEADKENLGYYEDGVEEDDDPNRTLSCGELSGGVVDPDDNYPITPYSTVQEYVELGTDSYRKDKLIPVWAEDDNLVPLLFAMEPEVRLGFPNLEKIFPPIEPGFQLYPDAVDPQDEWEEPEEGYELLSIN